MSSNPEFDDLGTTDRSPMTDWLRCVYGSYGWMNNEKPIHYLLTTFTVDDLKEGHLVSLMDEIPGVDKWGFDALFQRNLNMGRVEGIVREYIRREDRVKFFPAITLALLPSSGNELRRNYDDLFKKTPEKPDAGERSRLAWRLDGLEVLFPDRDGSTEPVHGDHARLRWDRRKFIAATIDGQHRVAAIRRYAGDLGQDALTSPVPALILVFDSDVPEGSDLIEVARELFIAVNEKADTVTEGRLILLDDRDVSRVAVRALMAEAVADSEGRLPLPDLDPIREGSDVRVLSGIPQELVDTKADRQHADLTDLAGWQYTSALTLARIVRDFVFESKWEKFEEVLDLAPAIEAGTAVGEVLAERREFLLAEVDEDDDEEDGSDSPIISDEEQFCFSPKITRAIVSQFVTPKVGRFITAVMTGFSPFANYLATALSAFREESTGELLRLYLINEGLEDDPGKGNSKYAGRLKKSETPDTLDQLRNRVATVGRPENWEQSLAWWSVAQRALFWRPLEIQAALELGSDESITSWSRCSELYLSALNELDERGVFDRAYKVRKKYDLWTGIALRPGNRIDYTDAAAKKTGCLIRLLVSGVLAKRRGLSFDEFVEALANSRRRLGPVKRRVTGGYWRAARRSDDLAGKNRKELDEYKAEAEKHYAKVLKSVCFA